MVDVINTSFRDANRRVKLEDPEMADVDIPEMVNVKGEQVVKLNAQERTAEWMSAHDVKRIAQQTCEEELSDESDDTGT